jgi:iron complex outermembrane receptor protein
MIMSLEMLQSVPEAVRLDAFAILMDAPDYNSFLNAMNINDGRFLIAWLGMSSDRYDLELEQTIQASSQFRIAWGAGLRRDEAKSIQIFHQTTPISRNQARLFANAEWHPEQNTVLNLGGMLEDYEDQSPIFSYRTAINYHFDRHHTVRANSARAYRMPTLYEEYVNFVVFINEPFNDMNTWLKTQGDLDPQRLDSLELGYIGNFSEHGLTFDIKLFKERYRDVIVQYRDFDYPDPDRGLADTTVLDNFNELINEGAYNYSNNGTVDIYGIELNAKFLPTQRDLIFLGYNYMHTEGKEIQRVENGVTYIDNDVQTRAPSHTLSLLLNHRFDFGFEGTAAYYYTDAMTWYNEGDPVPTYNRLDFKLSKKFKLAASNTEVSLIIQNANGKNYDFYNDNDYKNLWERRAYLQFKFSL